MYSIMSPGVARILAVIISALFAFVFGSATTPVTGWIIFGVSLAWFFSSTLTEKLPYSVPILNNVKTFTGRALNVRHSTQTFGGGDHVNTYQIMSFDVDTIAAVSLKLPESIHIRNGERVIVSGLLRRGVLNALAYRNLDRGIYGKHPVFAYAIFAGLSFIVSLVMFGQPEGKLMALIFLFFGCYFLQCCTAIQDAARNVKGPVL